jgi:cytochrome c-type protein NapB
MTAIATLLGMGVTLLTALACAGQVTSTTKDGSSDTIAAGQEETAKAQTAKAQTAGADQPAADAGAANQPGAAPTSAPEDRIAAPAIAPAPSEGPIQPEHPAELRARWATNPVAWSSASPEVFAVAFDREGSRDRSLAARSERRPYAGAPPVMGHSIDFGGTLDCMECHDVGRRIGKRVARPMSHQPLSNCTQCHTPGAKPDPFTDLSPPWPVASTFLGMESAGTGSRLGPGAPPTIPHTLQLRVRCLSCHGEFGYDGLRTDHPFRAQCTQCHVPTAALDPLAPVFGR